MPRWIPHGLRRTPCNRVAVRTSVVVGGHRYHNMDCPSFATAGTSAVTSPASDTSTTSAVSTAALTANKFIDPKRSDSMLQGFAGLYVQREFTDITLCVDGQEFPCHRNVLAISSPYFMAMFSGGLAESQQGHVEIHEMGAKTVELVLDYIYTGEVTLSEETVQNLLSAANLFQLIPLRGGCADYMIKHVSISNCLGIYFFAKAHQCGVLAKKAKELICKKFSVLCKEQEFLSLPHDKVVEILADDLLNVTREESVYEAALSWLNYCLEERKENLVDVMKHVRFANISSYYLCDRIDTNQLVQSSPALQEILNTVKYYHMLKSRAAEIDLNFLPRKGMSYERGIIIMANPYNEDGTRKFNTMEILLPLTGEIKHLCKLPHSVYMPGACITGEDQIFLAGGAIRKINYRGPFSTEGVSPNLFMYDRHFGSWQVKSKMNYGRSQFALCMLDGAIYAIGGQNESDILDSVERYDVQACLWTVVSRLPQPLRCITAVSFKGCLYVFGGENRTQISKAAYRYDPSEDTWLELPSMKVPRALAGSTVHNDRIYVIGGNKSVSPKWKKEFLPEHCITTVEIFDPVTSTWQFGPELPNALCGAGVVKYGNTILVVGGEDDKSWMAGLYMLRKDENGEKEYWEEGNELPSVMSTFGCVVANVPKDMVREDA